METNEQQKSSLEEFKTRLNYILHKQPKWITEISNEELQRIQIYEHKRRRIQNRQKNSHLHDITEANLPDLKTNLK